MATVVKVLAGEYDLSHQVRLQAEFDRVRTVQTLILDLSAVTYLDTTFVTELIRLHRMRAELGCDVLTIVRATPIVQKIFALLHISTFCRVVATLDEALPKDGARVVVLRACSGDNPPLRHPIRASKTNSPTPAWISRVLIAAGI